MFKPSMAELGLCMYQLEVLVQEHIPDLYGHFQSQSIHTNLYASSWFLTLFTTSLPIHLSCRIMDCFLADGLEAIFRLALALLMLGKNELLVQDMEGVIRVSRFYYALKRFMKTFFFCRCSTFKRTCLLISRPIPRESYTWHSVSRLTRRR